MAAMSGKKDVRHNSPGPSKMAGGMAMVDESRGKSFSVMQELVLADEKRSKEKEANSFQNLMEYREAPASPSASSVTTTLSLENCGSPSTPNSPPGQDVQDMDDERLPNELLDELYEDMGMKEGMELDFVEFLMEQDVDPQAYMTPEALRSSGFPTPVPSNSNSVINTPTNKSSADGGWGNRNCGSPSYSIASSTNVTVATSSGSSSPVSKRFHMSNSGPSSPVRANPPLVPQIGTNHVFKAPLTPPTPKKPIPNSQGAASPSSNLSVSSNQSGLSNHSNHSTHSNHSSQSSCQGNQSSSIAQSIPPRCYSPRSAQAGVPSPQLPHSTTGTFSKPPPQYGQFPNKGESTPSSPRSSCGAHVQPKTPTNHVQGYHRLGRPPPPNVNVQNMQQSGSNKWLNSQGPQSNNQGMVGSPSCAVNSSVSKQGSIPDNQGNMSSNQNNMLGNQGNMPGNQGSMPGNQGNMMSCSVQNPQSQYGRPLQSPLDQGYYTSSDTMSVRSFSSSATSTVPSNVSAASMQTINSQKQMMTGPTTPVQKSVHFAEGMTSLQQPQQQQRQPSMERLPYEFPYRTNVPDCELEEYRNTIQKQMQSKMMPRLNHHIKPETAPYIVPSNNGQTSMNPFDYPGTPNHTNNMSSPQVGMQQFDFSQKSTAETFDIDNNQNLVMPNFNDGMTASQSSITNMNCQVQQQAACSGPMGIQQQQMDPFRDQGQCQMQDPSKGAMYDPIMQNSMCKPNVPQIQGDANCPFPQQQGSNMNNGCGMMGMNPGMMGNQANRQGSIDQEFQGQQNFQGVANSQGYPAPAPQQNMACSSGPGRAMHLPGAQGGQPVVGYEQHFEQGRAMNMNNMGNQMYPPSQGSNMGDGMGMGTQAWAGGMPQTPQGPHQMGATPRSAPMNMPGQGVQMQAGGQCGQLSGIPCTLQNCSNCKAGSPNRPPIVASQQRFIQHLITDRSNAFRSHPLFPLLRDLIIADMNFNTPNFPYQLISNLPADFDKLLQNFLHRNPPAGNYQTNFAVESVIMDALKYAHHCLIEKIRQKQEQDIDKHSKSTSKSLSAIEEFCEKFDQSVRKSYIKPATLQLGGNPGNGMAPGTMGVPQMASGSMCPPEMGTPTKDMKFTVGSMGPMMMPGGMFASPMAKKELEFQHSVMMSPNFKSLKDLTDGASDCGSIVSSSSHSNKTESKKHPSLPKEAVAIMLDWLRQHKDNPYPNDDEKAMLIKQTGLTINQINYWFTNARRRILPKWAQQCK